MTQCSKTDLHHVVATAGAIEEGAKEHIDKNGPGGDAQRDAVDPLGGQPHV